jgi:polygalacturonase
MSIARRDFLRSGIAVAAVAAADCGCGSLSMRPPAKDAASWDDVPAILARIVAPQFAARDFVVTDFGAVADGQTDCHPAFAAAIAACSKAGGGRVVTPAADRPYLVNGPIHLLSNVNLYVESGAEILFGTNPSDYLPAVQIRYQGVRCYNYSPLIYAYQQSNIAITGGGRLNGQATAWLEWARLANPDFALLLKLVADGVPVEQRVFGAGHHLRLTMFEPYECTGVLVQGVTFMGSPFWTLHPTFCTNVTIQNVTVLAGQENDDGCDPDSCTDVLVEGCTFTTNDDNISIKAGFGADSQGLSPCQNIVIQDCRLVSTDWGGITVGSQTGSIVQHVFVQNCQVGKCSSAIYIKSSSQSGGAVKSVLVRSCSAAACDVFLNLETDYDYAHGDTPPLFNDISLENVSCEEAKAFAFSIEGDVRNPIVYVSLNNVAVGSAASVAEVGNALFVTSSNVTVAGRQVSVSGLS